MPMFLTSNCLVLIPKVDSPQFFPEFRPISLNNVSQKIVPKVMNDRLSKLLPAIISLNKSDSNYFIYGHFHLVIVDITITMLLSDQYLKTQKIINKSFFVLRTINNIILFCKFISVKTRDLGKDFDTDFIRFFQCIWHPML